MGSVGPILNQNIARQSKTAFSQRSNFPHIIHNIPPQDMNTLAPTPTFIEAICREEDILFACLTPCSICSKLRFRTWRGGSGRRAIAIVYGDEDDGGGGDDDDGLAHCNFATLLEFSPKPEL